MTIRYAGIGSRETPDSILSAFEEIGEKAATADIILRSGRAPGADSRFEKGCHKNSGVCQIFTPWPRFPNGSDLLSYPEIPFDSIEPAQKERAIASVKKYHPAPDRLSPAAMKLMARNYCQMFGASTLDHETDLVVCWTKDGKASGGTGQAIRMAQDNNIPVLNAHGFETHPADFVTLVLQAMSSLLQQ